MRLSLSRLAPRGVTAKNTNLKGKRRFIGVALLLAAIILGALFGYFHNSNKKGSNSPVSASAFESMYKTADNKLLNSGDVESYQVTQRNLAAQYLSTGDTANAERVMNDLFSKIPANKVDAASYEIMASTQNIKKDNVQYKHYLQLVINKLKEQGDIKGAALEQKVLDSVK